MDYICYCPPAGLQDALANLPATLDETYTRTLREIKEAKWKYAHRILQFVAVASRPLRVKELAELFAFDFEVGSIPKFDEDCRPEDPADEVLSACSTLLSIVDDECDLGHIIQFSHFSVKEFLTSTRLAEVTDTISRRYHISMTPAHTLAAQSCLGILLHLNKDVITHDSLEDFPLAEYAAEHWVDHAQFEDVSRNVEDGIKQLFDPSRPHLAVCVWICDPAVPRWVRGERREVVSAISARRVDVKNSLTEKCENYMTFPKRCPPSTMESKVVHADSTASAGSSRRQSSSNFGIDPALKSNANNSPSSLTRSGREATATN